MSEFLKMIPAVWGASRTYRTLLLSSSRVIRMGVTRSRVPTILPWVPVSELTGLKVTHRDLKITLDDPLPHWMPVGHKVVNLNTLLFSFCSTLLTTL